MTKNSDQMADTPCTQQRCLGVMKDTEALLLQVIAKHQQMEPGLPAGEHTVS